MVFHSIRWRIQLWHGLLLVLVLTGFGFTAHHLEQGDRLRRIDQDLQHRISVLAGVLRGGERGPPRRPGAPPPGGDPEFSRVREGEPPFERPPGRRPPPPPPPLRGGFRLNEKDTDLFDEGGTNAFYYVLWSRTGEELSRSSNAPAVSRPPRGEQAHNVVERGLFREMYHYTPPGECILTGRNIAVDLADGRHFALLLLGAGGLVLVLGLAGGWWLSGRAIRPIQDISATAAKISSGDLKQRIPAGDTENELGQLAQVLNSTFGRLEATFAQQARFTSDAAHELRTPVSVMLTQTQSVLTRERSAEEYRETIEACQRAAQRMRRLIESLLELSRLDAGQEPIKRERFDLARTAADCVELVRPLAAERKIALHAELSRLECVGDADRISQVITNLLGNAVFYNQEGGIVRVVAQQRNGTAMVSVTDTGIGISAEDLPHIFDRFFRADKSRTRSSGRAGLGLAIAKTIVDAHGGTIEVSSEPGKGSTFTLKLPGMAGSSEATTPGIG